MTDSGVSPPQTDEPTENQNQTLQSVHQPLHSQNLSQQGVKECSDCVEKYRMGAINKIQALLDIQSIVEKHVPPETKEESTVKALRSYLDYLDNFDGLRQSIIDRNCNDDREPSPVRDQIHDSDSDGEQPFNSRGVTPDVDVSRAIVKRKRSFESDIPTSSNSSVPSHKRRVEPGRFAWVIKEAISPCSLSAELKQTQSTLENFSRDPKYVKSSLLNSSQCPQFPDGEWSNIISGKFVDLDHIFSGIYSIAPDNRQKQQVGGIELVVGTSAPAKNVRSHSNWTIAWDQFADALLYVFPHRQAELAAYGKYVRQLFASIPTDKHMRVIQFDKAVRLRASQRRDILLTDYDKFIDLNILWLQNGGIGSSTSASNNLQSRAGTSK